jgi:transcriptional regulator with XRE-family HTH domain
MLPGAGSAPSEELASARIRQAREGRGFTQLELARRVGASATSVWRWEHGRSRPTYRHLQVLCQVLAQPPGALRGEDRGRSGRARARMVPVALRIARALASLPAPRRGTAACGLPPEGHGE